MWLYLAGEIGYEGFVLLRVSDFTVTEAERWGGESILCTGVDDIRLSEKDLIELSTSTSVESREKSASLPTLLG